MMEYCLCLLTLFDGSTCLPFKVELLSALLSSFCHEPFLALVWLVQVLVGSFLIVDNCLCLFLNLFLMWIYHLFIHSRCQFFNFNLCVWQVNGWVVTLFLFPLLHRLWYSSLVFAVKPHPLLSVSSLPHFATADWIAQVKRLKVKALDIYIPPLTGKPRPAAVYNWSGVLTGNDTVQCIEYILVSRSHHQQKLMDLCWEFAVI